MQHWLHFTVTKLRVREDTLVGLARPSSLVGLPLMGAVGFCPLTPVVESTQIPALPGTMSTV